MKLIKSLQNIKPINYTKLLMKCNKYKILYESEKIANKSKINGYKGQCARLKNKIKKLEGEIKNGN